jgi:hypothetical protein
MILVSHHEQFVGPWYYATVIRTATAFPGMTGEAVSWAKEVVALVKRVSGKEQIVCSSFSGMLTEVAWIGQYDSAGQI